MANAVAEVVAVGTEILMGQITDTNSQAIGALLPELGIRHYHRQTVGDNVERAAEALRLALSRADIVFTIGGLGPTEDDITREAIALALDDYLTHDPSIEAGIRELFAVRRIPWTDAQGRQALKPACATALHNPNGTAPGLDCHKGGKTVLAMPGPKSEFNPMLKGPVRRILEDRYPPQSVLRSRLLKICGVGESVVEQRILGLIHGDNPTVAPYAHPGDVHLRITGSGQTAEAADEVVIKACEAIRAEFGRDVYGEGADTLEFAIVEMLKHSRATLACAESITAGAFGARIATVEGCGEVFLGGITPYDADMKSRLLGVDSRILEDPSEGPVSEPVARQMAEGVAKMFKADYGVALTGNAGPTSDFGDKPVGLVYVAVHGPGGTQVEEHPFRGTRDMVSYRAAMAAMILLYRVLRI